MGKNHLLSAFLFLCNTAVALIADDAAAQEKPAVIVPRIFEAVCPVSEMRFDDELFANAYAAVRKPPGEGPFPAVIFLHGGLGSTKMDKLRENALTQPTQSRFLAWGYVTVCSTRRSIAHDPGDRGLVADMLKIVAATRELPFVDPDSIVLYGGSGGGTLALEVAGEPGAKLAAVAAGEPATIIFMGMFNKSHVNFDDSGQPRGDQRNEVMRADPKSLYTPELQARTRNKIKAIACPVLILHGDRHPLKKFNLDLFVPEMENLGKSVETIIYPGENHGFYWGRSANPAMPLKANRDADRFFKEHIRTAPEPIPTEHIREVPVGNNRDRQRE